MTEKKKPTTRRPRGDGAKHVYDQLRREILTLELKPGQPLDETRLSQRFETSRSPIREALVRLSADGLVVTLSNRSTLVAPIDISMFPRYVDALDFLQRINTRLAAKNRTEEDLQVMTALARDFELARQEGDPMKVSMTNREFHMAIANAGGNQYLAKPYRDLLDEGRRLLHLNLDYLRATAKEAFHNRDHQAMIDAIRDQDVALADKLAHEHTKTFHDRFMESLKADYINDFSFDAYTE